MSPRRRKPLLILLHLRSGSKPRSFKTDTPPEFFSSLLKAEMQSKALLVGRSLISTTFSETLLKRASLTSITLHDRAESDREGLQMKILIFRFARYFLTLTVSSPMVVSMLLLALLTSNCSAQRLSEEPSHVPSLVTSSKVIAKPAPEKRIRLTISLPLQNRGELETLLRDLYDPKSPRYHHFLSSQEFVTGFAPTEQDFQAVTSFLKSNRLTIISTEPDRSLVTVDGTIQDVERAFKTNIRMYRTEKIDRVFLAPDTEPTYPKSVPILHIRGLDTLTTPRRHISPSRFPFPFPFPNPNPSGPFTGPFHAKDLREAYVQGVSLTGKGQTVGHIFARFWF